MLTDGRNVMTCLPLQPIFPSVLIDVCAFCQPSSDPFSSSDVHEQESDGPSEC